MTGVPKQWLSEKVSIERAEKENTLTDKPFGHLHRKWQKLKSGIQSGDELWEFVSPPESWAHHMGRQGYAIVRRGQVVEFLLTTD
jgi:hypothetical protein